jgi:chaperone BCS1
MPLKDLSHDTDLGRLLQGIGPRSMLLLEDVDVSHAATERTETAEGISASGLLNALDGVITPDGLVTVMTTNKRDELDDALVRPGRADREVELTYLDDDQFNRLAERLVGGQWSVDGLAGLEITPAEVVEVVKRHMTDHQAAALALIEWLAGRKGVGFDPNPIELSQIARVARVT